MSRVFTPHKATPLLQSKNNNNSNNNNNNKTTNKTTPLAGGDRSTVSADNANASVVVDFDDFTSSSSILEFLSKEQECCSDADAESIFQEVNRLSDNSDTRSVDEILREAELLIQQQTLLGGGVIGVGRAVNSSTKNASSAVHQKQTIKMNSKYTKLIENVRPPPAAPIQNGRCSVSPPPLLPPQPQPTRRLPKDFIVMPHTPSGGDAAGACHFEAFVDNLPSESVLSEESTPKEMFNCSMAGTEQDATLMMLHDGGGGGDDDDTDADADDATDTMEEITEGIETIELLVGHDGDGVVHANDASTGSTTNASFSSLSLSSMSSRRMQPTMQRRPSCEAFVSAAHHLPPCATPTRAPLNFNATQACSPSPGGERRGSGGSGARRSSMTTPDSGISGHTQSTTAATTCTPRPTYSPHRTAAAAASAEPAGEAAVVVAKPALTYCDKSVNSSPKHLVSTLTSPIGEQNGTITREHVLKQDIEQLQEKLKDTEERLQSLRLQHDSLSQVQRDLRESNTQRQEESEMLKLDVQHLNECANILRSELQTARADRNEALELQHVLKTELEESRQEKKRVLEQKEKDAKVIQDLQRQCREMERILMRKHPDSVSALIVASKNPGKCISNDQENLHSRKLLEQRIAQLESDAKEQDKKAQQILANVQARFNSVQAKYETHIADLETQVLSLQEINTKLNEKIESQVRTLDYFVTKKAEKYYNNCTQTDAVATAASFYATEAARANATTGTQTPAAAVKAAAVTRDHSTNTIGSAAAALAASQAHSASSSTSSTANSTPNNSRPNSKQSGLRKPTAATLSKLPVSQSDSTIALTAYHAAAKEDAHLLATIRGMRVDLAIKDKAMQRLSRELDECKKTIRKLQREKEAFKHDKPHSGSSTAATSRAPIAHYGSDYHTPANTENQALKEAQNKIKLLEADYKSLHDKRLQDLKTLQTAHERELASCHESVRILQQRLNERDEAFAMQKRRKLPVDYYALKAKVSSLERRHSEREERLHMLVEALSKGRLNGALEDLLSGDSQ